MKFLLKKIFTWFCSLWKRDKDIDDTPDGKKYTVKGYGLSIWGIDDSQEIMLKNISNKDDIQRLRTGDFVYVKSPLKCVHCPDDYTLMRFIGLFDLRPADVEESIKALDMYFDNDDVFVHLPSKKGLYRWSEFINRYFREMPGMSMRLWEKFCCDYENEYFEQKKYKDTDYHNVAVVCIKFGVNPVNYYLVPSEWIDSVNF